MAYAIFRLDKVNSFSEARAKERHGKLEERWRVPDRSHPERGVVKIPMKNYKCELVEALKQRLSVLDKAPRKNSVLCYEMIFAFSPEKEKDIMSRQRDWIIANGKWLSDTFGSENVLQVRLDLDEKTPHLHAFVTPITKDGRLCAREFTGGKVKLNQLQTSYANAMKPFGLERGQNYMEDPSKLTCRHEPCSKFWYFQKAAAARKEIGIESKFDLDIEI